jgi:hypothetical protein
MLQMQTADSTRTSQAPLTAQSTPFVSRQSTPVPPASQVYSDFVFGEPNSADYARTSAPRSLSVYANHYQGPLTSNNMSVNTTSFEQLFEFRMSEVGMPLSLQNGNLSGYQDYTDRWNSGTQ